MFRERRTRPKQISVDLLRFALSVKLRKPRGKLKLKVSNAPPVCYSRFRNLTRLCLIPSCIAKVAEAEAKKKAQLAKGGK